MADLASFMATVRGRVQGVFFRASVMRRARELGLTGYVRNRHDGSVEHVLMKSKRAGYVTDTGDEKERICTDD